MGTRKDYPFPRRAYKQGCGILSNIVLACIGLGVCAAKGIKNAVESNAVDVEYADKFSRAFLVVFYTLLAILAILMFVLVSPLISDIFITLF